MGDGGVVPLCRAAPVTAAHVVLLAAVCAAAAAALTEAVRRYAATAMLDVPNARSSHAVPTPRGGGVGIVIPTLACLLLWPLVVDPTSRRASLAFAAGAGVVALIGWLDDRRSLSVGVRLATHAVAAAIVIIYIGAWESLELPFDGGAVALGAVGPALTFVWIVGLTNAYNFMDGIDGLAGGQAVVAGVGWTILGSALDQPLVMAVGLVAAAASLGFLWHNWPPARIFLGDVGSGFLGYTWAVLPVLSAASSAHPTDASAPWLGLVLVWPMVFDATATLLRRLSAGENIAQAHRSHFYQRLVGAGWRHVRVTTLYFACATLGVAVALAWATRHPWLPGLVFAIPASAAGLWACVIHQEGGEARHRRHE